jgi:hypothetical protein
MQVFLNGFKTQRFARLTNNQGCDFSANIVLLNDDSSAYSLNSAQTTISCTVRKSYYSTNVWANLVCTITNAANGNIQCNLSASNSANIPAATYLYDVVMQDTGNNVTQRILEGQFLVTPSVTQLYNAAPIPL